MGGEEFVWRTISYGASKDLILVHIVQLKPMITAHSSGKMVSSGISDIVIASVHSENPSEEVDDYYYYRINRKKRQCLAIARN